MRIKNSIPTIFFSFILLAIASCGGGGGGGGSSNNVGTDPNGGISSSSSDRSESSSSASSDNDGNSSSVSSGTNSSEQVDPSGQYSGVFIDGPVSGLEYQILDDRFLTDENGIFKFDTDDIISFYIGNLYLGSARGALLLTPLDLVPDALDETDDRVINLIRFLQTIDDDGDLSNGIQITENVRRIAEAHSLNFGLPKKEFEDDSFFLITDLTSATAEGPRELVSESSALNHFRDTLQEIDAIGTVQPIEGSVITKEEAAQVLIDAGPSLWQTDFVYGIFQDIGDFPTSGTRIETAGRGRSMFLVRPESGDIDSCDPIDDPTPLTSDLFYSLGNSAQICQDGSTTVKRTASGGLGVEHYCGEQLASSGTAEKISTATEFDQGSLTVNSVDLSANINTSDGVCGTISKTTATITTVVPNTEDNSTTERTSDQWTVILRAPYENGWMNIFLNFTGSHTRGIYPHSGDEIEDYDKPHAAFAFFPGEDENIPPVANGTVDVKSVSLSSLNGTYDFVTEAGTELTGSFTLDLR